MSRRGANLLLKSIRLFGYSLALLQAGGPNLRQQVSLKDIPEDIRTLEKRLNLDVDTTIFAVCLNDNEPIKTFEFYSFLDWFGRFIAFPGIAQYSDAFCEQLSDNGPPADKRESPDGRFYYEVRGPDGKLFVQERGREGRWFSKLHADFFNIEGNKINGKHSSTGVITMSCLNLPLYIREDSAFVYIAGVIQGPHEPDSKEAEHNHYIRPLIDELLVAYSRGIRCAS
ncbi:hypothetical protein F5051DRAFT_333455, partial [Lentinula edodes]